MLHLLCFISKPYTRLQRFLSCICPFLGFLQQEHEPSLWIWWAVKGKENYSAVIPCKHLQHYCPRYKHGIWTFRLGFFSDCSKLKLVKPLYIFFLVFQIQASTFSIETDLNFASCCLFFFFPCFFISSSIINWDIHWIHLN